MENAQNDILKEIQEEMQEEMQEQSQYRENSQYNDKTSICEKVIAKTEMLINERIDKDLSNEDIDILGKLVDIHKDMSNEKYWKVKESVMMRYDNYGNYNGYDRYDTYDRNYNDDYGRRGSGRRYRGHEHIDRMYNDYGRYEEGREQYNRGNYNAKEDTLKSLKYMLESAVDFFGMLKSEATSQEEMQMVREYAKKISEI